MLVEGLEGFSVLFYLNIALDNFTGNSDFSQNGTFMTLGNYDIEDFAYVHIWYFSRLRDGSY
jgi:hypothetical protein